MMVLVLSRCPASLRGDLSKWLIEIHTGVYVGNPGRRVRDKLWERVKSFVGQGTAIMAYSTQNEQNLSFEVFQSDWIPEDFDGITLIRHPIQSSEEKISSEHLKPVYQLPKKSSVKKKRARLEIPEEFIILDLETTGLDPEEDEITEIGALKISRMCEVDEFQCYVTTKKPIPAEIEKLTHITDEILEEKGIPPEEALYYFSVFSSSLPILGHNIGFDRAFLKESSLKYQIEFAENESIDTMTLARRLLPGIQNYKLRTLLQHFGIMNRPEHSALEDCKSILMLLKKLNEMDQIEDK